MAQKIFENYKILMKSATRHIEKCSDVGGGS